MELNDKFYCVKRVYGLHDWRIVRCWISSARLHGHYRLNFDFSTSGRWKSKAEAILSFMASNPGERLFETVGKAREWMPVTNADSIDGIMAGFKEVI